jgi:hypothetical protein
VRRFSRTDRESTARPNTGPTIQRMSRRIGIAMRNPPT